MKLGEKSKGSKFSPEESKLLGAGFSAHF